MVGENTRIKHFHIVYLTSLKRPWNAVKSLYQIIQYQYTNCLKKILSEGIQTGRYESNEIITYFRLKMVRLRILKNGLDSFFRLTPETAIF